MKWINKHRYPLVASVMIIGLMGIFFNAGKIPTEECTLKIETGTMIIHTKVNCYQIDRALDNVLE